MPREPLTIEDVLFGTLSPSALARGEAEVGDDRAIAEGRVAIEALAKSVPPSAVADEGDASAPRDARDARVPLRERLRSTLTRGGKYGVFVDRVARLFDISIEAAEKLLARVDDPSQLKYGLGEGIGLIMVRPGPKYPGAYGAIGRLKPGARFPHHEHAGSETTLVLEGGFLDASGEEVWRGDEMIKEAGSSHDFVVIEGGDCVACVIAHGGVRF